MKKQMHELYIEYYVETSQYFTCRNSKLNFSSSCFIADDSHVITVWLHVVVSNEHDILHFLDNVHLFKYYLVKVLQNCFNSFN